MKVDLKIVAAIRITDSSIRIYDSNVILTYTTTSGRCITQSILDRLSGGCLSIDVLNIT